MRTTVLTMAACLGLLLALLGSWLLADYRAYRKRTEPWR